jgi:hypothetical protein
MMAPMFKPPANRNKKPKPVSADVAKLDLSRNARSKFEKLIKPDEKLVPGPQTSE